MERSDFVPQIPYGTHDFLPEDAARKRKIESDLAALFSRWGYDEVITPTFEYLDNLMVGCAADLTNNVFKFLERNNRILALRPDMTTPIARVVATRLRDARPPLKLFYLTNVFRHEQAQAGRQCEFYQAGAELLGVPGPAADAEVIALAVEVMLEAGLENFQISLGQVDFINGIMAESDLSAAERHQIKQYIVKRDLVGLGELLNGSGLAGQAKDILGRVPLLHGKEDVLTQAYRAVNNSVSKAALDNLAEIYRLLASYGVEARVFFDLGLIRDFDYYTGMVFEGYTPGLGFPLCGGGRYDKMLGSMGADWPATGFALGIERVLLALERQGKTITNQAKDVYIGWAQDGLHRAIAEARKLRQSGLCTELALLPESREEAERSRQIKGYAKLLYLE